MINFRAPLPFNILYAHKYINDLEKGRRLIMMIRGKIAKKIGSLMLLVVGAFSLVSCGGAAEQKSKEETASADTVRIGTIQNPDDEAIAVKQKYFEDQIGKKVEVMNFDSGSDVNVALASGSIDFAYIGSSPATIAISQGNADVEMIWIHRVLGSVESLATKKSQNINSLSDLKGKTVAVTFASTTHYSLLRMLQKEGIDPSEVNLVDMQGAEMQVAWENGQIDAAYIWEPFLSKFSDSKILISSKDAAAAGYPTADVELVNKKFAEKNPDVVVNYIKALNKSVDMYKNNKDEAVSTIAGIFQISKEDAEFQMSGFEWMNIDEQMSENYMGTSAQKGKMVDCLYDTAKFLYEQKSLNKLPEKSVFEQAVNPTYLEKAKEE